MAYERVEPMALRIYKLYMLFRNMFSELYMVVIQYHKFNKDS